MTELDSARVLVARAGRGGGQRALALPALVLLAAAPGCSASSTSSAVAAGELRGTRSPAPPRSRASLMSPGDDWQHLRQVLGYYKCNPPQRPAVYLLGGSVGRESTINDLNWRRQIVDFGGPTVEAFNLGSMNQSFDDNIAHGEDHARRADAGHHRREPGALHLARGDPAVTANAHQADTSGVIIALQRAPVHVQDHIAGDVRKRERVQKWLDERYPVFKTNFRYNAGRLDDARRPLPASAGSIRSS